MSVLSVDIRKDKKMTNENDRLRVEWMSLGDTHQGVDLIDSKMNFLFKILLSMREKKNK